MHARSSCTLTRVLITAVSFAFCGALLEGTSHVYLRFTLPPDAGTEDNLPPIPYRGSDYLTPAFFAEVQKGSSLVPVEGSPHFVPEETAGRYINVVDGRRVTTDQPPSPERRVLAFGGSTMFSEEVPDWYTIPSFLQRLINTHCEGPVAVVNYGVSAMNIVQQRSRLFSTEVRPGDIVVFYGGVNSVYFLIHAGGRSYGSPPGFIDRVREAAAWLRQKSAAAAVVVDVWESAPPAAVSEPAGLRANLDRAERDYRDEVTSAHRFVSARGGEFVHFLQPQLFSTGLSTPYRRQLGQDYPGLETSFRLGYPRLRRALAAAEREAGVRSWDLSDLLAVERVPGEVFFDFAHVNETANGMVAGAMFARLAPQIGDCSSRPPGAPSVARALHRVRRGDPGLRQRDVDRLLAP